MLGFIVLHNLLGRSTTPPLQGRWEAHRLPLRIVAGKAAKLMGPYGSRLQILTI